MSNVTLLAKFTVGQTVFCKLAAPTANDNTIVIESKITDRYETSTLGWIYRISGTLVLLEEKMLRASMQEIKNNEGNPDGESAVIEENGWAVDLDRLFEAHASAKYKPGQYVKMVTDYDDVKSGAYGIIAGISFFEGLLAYDVATLFSDEGKFFDNPCPFDEEDFEPVDRGEIDAFCRALRPRFKLSVVR